MLAFSMSALSRSYISYLFIWLDLFSYFFRSEIATLLSLSIFLASLFLF